MCILLSLDQATASSLAAILELSSEENQDTQASEEPDLKHKELRAVLQKYGIRKMTPEHAARVLAQRNVL